jgi:hypothetical protein
MTQRAHPVLIMGISATSKTSMISSLLYYPSVAQSPLLSLRAGPDLFPADFPKSGTRNAAGRVFLDYCLRAMARREAPEFTTGDPYYTSITATFAPRGGEPYQRNIGFLEIMGEHFEPDSRRLNDQARENFLPLLRDFDAPLSIIFCAPAVVEGSGQRQADAHQALVNCIAKYRDLRGDRQSSDHLLYLLTYWDEVSDDNGSPLSVPTKRQISRQLQAPALQTSWNAFSHLPGHKAFLPYTAGKFDRDGDERTLDVISAPGNVDYARFNEALWNWLYGNIRLADDARERPYLHPRLKLPSLRKTAMESFLGTVFYRPTRWLIKSKRSAAE